MTRHFKVLESEGYVSRKRNPINQREVLVELTQEAKNQLLVNPPKHHLRVKEQMESILSTTEQRELITLLTKLVSGLEKIEFLRRKTMSIITTILATTLPSSIFYIFYLESIATQSDATSRVFNMDKEELNSNICYLTV